MAPTRSTRPIFYSLLLSPLFLSFLGSASFAEEAKFILSEGTAVILQDRLPVARDAAFEGAL